MNGNLRGNQNGQATKERDADDAPRSHEPLPKVIVLQHSWNRNGPDRYTGYVAVQTEVVAHPPVVRKYLRALWLAAITVVIVGSLLPGTSMPMRALDMLQVSDKLEHFGAYAFLAFLPAIHERKGFIVAAALGAVALGVALEYGQLYSGWRDFEYADMVADAAGVGCGLAAGIPLRATRIVRSVLSIHNG